MSQHDSESSSRTIVIRSVPLLVAELMATAACVYYFPTSDLKGVTFCALAIIASIDTLIGTRFTFETTSLKLVERLRRWPCRIPYSKIDHIDRESIGNRIFLTVRGRGRALAIGGWHIYVFPSLRQRLDEIQKEFSWRVRSAEG